MLAEGLSDKPKAVLICETINYSIKLSELEVSIMAIASSISKDETSKTNPTA